MDITKKKYRLNIQGMIVEEIDEIEIEELGKEDFSHYPSEPMASENVIVAL